MRPSFFDRPNFCDAISAPGSESKGARSIRYGTIASCPFGNHLWLCSNSARAVQCTRAAPSRNIRADSVWNSRFFVAPWFIDQSSSIPWHDTTYGTPKARHADPICTVVGDHTQCRCTTSDRERSARMSFICDGLKSFPSNPGCASFSTRGRPSRPPASPNQSVGVSVGSSVRTVEGWPASAITRAQSFTNLGTPPHCVSVDSM